MQDDIVQAYLEIEQAMQRYSLLLEEYISNSKHNPMRNPKTDSPE